jgi:hypothetical protein
VARTCHNAEALLTERFPKPQPHAYLLQEAGEQPRIRPVALLPSTQHVFATAWQAANKVVYSTTLAAVPTAM